MKNKRLLLVGTMLLGGLCTAQGTDVNAQGSELILVAEDMGDRRPGCEAISHVHLDNPDQVHRGKNWANLENPASPGRMAAPADMRFAIASPSNTASLRPGLYLIDQLDPTSGEWRTRGVSAPDLFLLGAIAVDAAGEFLYRAESDTRIGQTCGARNFWVSKYNISDVLSGQITEDDRVAVVSTEAPVAEIVIDEQSNVVHFVEVSCSTLMDRVAPRVTTHDKLTLAAVDPGISIGDIVTPSREQAIGVTHAEISDNGSTIYVNGWEKAELHLVNVVSRTASSIEIPFRRRTEHTGGISLGRAGPGKSLLAVHGIDRIGVFDISDPEALVHITEMEVPPPIEWTEQGILGSTGHEGGPAGTIRWTANGQYIVAATSTRGPFEFQIYEFDGSALHHYADIETCPYRQSNYGNDILTASRQPTLPPPSPTATRATPNATASSTATATVAATSTPEPSASATAEPTPAQVRIHLPVALKERCSPKTRRQDAIVVIDTSSSMMELTRAGRAKLEAAKAAAQSYIELLSLSEGDRVALVSFDEDARTHAALTSEKKVFETALDEIRVGQQTCLPCAISQAAGELSPSKRRVGNTAVIILLTDGRSNPRPASDAVIEAQSAKEGGVVIFTIGIGDALDSDALQEMASQPAYFFVAPDAEDLGAIYKRIAVDVPCEPSRFWGKR